MFADESIAPPAGAFKIKHSVAKVARVDGGTGLYRTVKVSSRASSHTEYLPVSQLLQLLVDDDLEC